MDLCSTGSGRELVKSSLTIFQLCMSSLQNVVWNTMKKAETPQLTLWNANCCFGCCQIFNVALVQNKSLVGYFKVFNSKTLRYIACSDCLTFFKRLLRLEGSFYFICFYTIEYPNKQSNVAGIDTEFVFELSIMNVFLSSFLYQWGFLI